MKKSVCTVLTLLAGSFAVHSQGTVNFGNYSTVNQYIYVSIYTGSHGVALLGGSASGPPATLFNYYAEVQNGNDWTVELYGAPGAGVPFQALVPTGATATLANGGVDPLAGTWYSSTIATIAGSGLAGSPATIALAAWYNAGGTITSFSQAFADGVPTGFSATATVLVGGQAASGPPVTPPTLPASLGNFTLGALPEPSTVTLTLVGVAGFIGRYQIMRRRNK